MGNALTGGQERRWLARALLAFVVGLLTVLIALPNGPLAGVSMAQQASPSPTVANPVKFINPSTGGPGTEISFKDDNADPALGETFHLVAGAKNAPSGSKVTFKYKKGSDPEITIAEVPAVGGSDAFDTQWAKPAGLGEGSVTLSATLADSSNNILSRDEIVATVNDADPGATPTEENRGETVEITAPANGTALGFYKQANNTHVGGIAVSMSADVANVDVFFSKAPIGSAPTWTSCGTETKANAANGVRCTLPADTQPADVTAIGALAKNTANTSVPAGTDADSGDAHRVYGYSQTPGSFTFAPGTSQEVPPDASGNFACSQVFTATLLDTDGRPIAGANVDIHAQHPVDEIFFDDSDATGTNNTSPSQAPDASHSSATEGAVDCEGTAIPRAFSGTQGRHESGGAEDIKHIESTAPGTDDSGSFKFQVYNRTKTTGVTQVTIWADRDNDDQLCNGEASGNVAVGWGTPPGTPSGVTPDLSDCPTPSPSASPSASPTATPSPTASPTTSPTASPTESPTFSPTPSEDKHSRDVDFNLKDAKQNKLSISGKVTVDDGFNDCRSTVPVKIQKKKNGKFKTIKQISTNGKGKFDTKVKDKTGKYRVLAPKVDLGLDVCTKAQEAKTHKH